MNRKKIMTLLAVTATAAFLMTGCSPDDTGNTKSSSVQASSSSEIGLSAEAETGISAGEESPARDGQAEEGEAENVETSSSAGSTSSSSTKSSGSSSSSTKSTGSSSGSSTKSSGSSSSGSKSTGSSSSSSSGSSSSSSSASTHTHNWVAQTKTVHHGATGHYETVTVVDVEAYDEQVLVGYEDICNKCGADLSSLSDVELGLHIKRCDCGYTSQPKYETIHHDAVTHTEQKWVQDTAAYDETVTTGYKCSTCGATK